MTIFKILFHFMLSNQHNWISPNPRERQQWNVSVTIMYNITWKKKKNSRWIFQGYFGFFQLLSLFQPGQLGFNRLALWESNKQTNTQYWTTLLLIKKVIMRRVEQLNPSSSLLTDITDPGLTKRAKYLNSTKKAILYKYAFLCW